MINYYSFLNQISIPKQPLQIRTNQDVINYTKSGQDAATIKCTTTLDADSKIQVKIFNDNSTQVVSQMIDQSTQYEEPKQIKSEIAYTDGLLSQMESVDLNEFQPRMAMSMQESQPQLLQLIQQQNTQIYSQLQTESNQELLKFISQQTIDKSTTEIKNTISQYIQQLQMIQQGLNPQAMQQYSIVEQMSFSEQQSPGWMFTPTLKVAQSFSEDSLINE